MKALFDNLVLAAALSALHASPNYPVANLQSSFLKKRFQSTAAADTVTVTFAADKAIDCVYYAFTNATGIVILLKNAGGGTVKTITIVAPEDPGAVHFTAVPGVRTIDVQLTGAGPGLYLGGLGAGLEGSLPNPASPWDEQPTDNSSASSSPDGQWSQDYLTPLRSYSWQFAGMERDDALALLLKCTTLGIGKPMWLDAMEDDHAFLAPIYCVLTRAPKITKSGRRYAITISIMEAR
jgi:hypothetical protein